MMFFLLLIVMAVYFKRLRSKLFDRMIVLIIGSMGLLMALVPEWSNRIAHAVGVGRGVDLVIYLSIVGLAFLWIGLYTRVRDLETQQTQLVRHLALAQARFPVQHVQAEQHQADSPELTTEETHRPCESA
jgi:hypothetical protein